MKRIIIVVVIALTVLVNMGCKASDYKVNNSKQKVNSVSVEDNREYTSNYYKVTDITDTGIQCDDLYSVSGYYLDKTDKTIDLSNIKLNDEIEIQHIKGVNGQDDILKDVKVVLRDSEDYTSTYYIATSVTDKGIKCDSFDGRLKGGIGNYFDKSELKFIDLKNVQVGDKLELQSWHVDKKISDDNWKDIVIVR
jgi:hypothetical protein